MVGIEPQDDFADACIVAGHTNDFNDLKRKQLFDRGFGNYTHDDGSPHYDMFVSAVEDYGVFAADDIWDRTEHRQPFINDPGILTVVGSFAAWIADQHEVYEDVPRYRNQVYEDIKNLTREIFMDIVEETDIDRVHRDVAQKIWERSPRPGTRFTGFTVDEVKSDLPFSDGEKYIEMPLKATWQKVVTTSGEADGLDEKDITSHLHDNKVYVPVSEIRGFLEDEWDDSFEAQIEYIEQKIYGETKQSVLEREEKLSHRIDRYERARHTEDLYLNYDPEEAKLRILVKAVKQARDAKVQLGDELTAKEIHQCVRVYEPSEYEERDIETFHNPRAIAQFLSRQSDKESVEVLVDRETNTYILRPMGGSVRQVEINEPEDIFEFPCFQSMDERFQEKGPTRKELFSLVRWLWSLPQYQNSSLDEFIGEMKDLFSRWPWYDPETTEYQVRYEITRGEIDGEEPLPIGCKNPDMELHCIGRHECPYSLYHSVDFPQSIYDRLDG